MDPNKTSRQTARSIKESNPLAISALTQGKPAESNVLSTASLCFQKGGNSLIIRYKTHTSKIWIDLQYQLLKDWHRTKVILTG